MKPKAMTRLEGRRGIREGQWRKTKSREGEKTDGLRTAKMKRIEVMKR